MLGQVHLTCTERSLPSSSVPADGPGVETTITEDFNSEYGGVFCTIEAKKGVPVLLKSEWQKTKS